MRLATVINSYRHLISTLMVIGSVAMCSVATDAPTCRAYTGGPITIQVLGYDRVERKVFFQQDNHDESGDLPRVGYFALSSRDPSRPQWVHFKPGTDDRQARIAIADYVRRLARRLNRLVPANQYDLAMRVRTVREDTLRIAFFRTARCSLEVNVDCDSLSASTSFMTFGAPRVGVWAFYRIPDEPVALAIVSADAKRYESWGEELQRPVLLLRR